MGIRAIIAAEFLAWDSDAALADMLKGLGILSGREVGGERLTVAYETKAQEDEQDCFSDNTHNDLIGDAVGMQNIYLGRYISLAGHSVRGASLRDLVTRADPALAGRLTAAVENAAAAMRGIPAPFDQAILGTDTAPGRVAIKKAMYASQTESDLIAQAAKALGLKLNL